ncbi:MAG TPA: hypothetical protein EYP14_02485, partial [Planctomycetaceae bacterium]|nr:hypothetical protein [Planctomycetaceae bacterium]
RPEVTAPRATDGDERYEPAWEQKLTIRIGTKTGDLVGSTEKAIQAAVDYVAARGGGTVHILPGTYTFRNAVYLPSGVRLVGSGNESVIMKCPSVTVPLAADSDWYDQEITLKDAKGFRVGDGIVLTARDPSTNGPIVIKRTLVARSGNRFKLNDGLRKNLWLMGQPRASLLFPLLTAEYASDILIENLTLDGNRQHNENLNGNYGGCIFLQDCNRITIRNVTARNYNGDAISFQICHDVIVESCRCHDNAGLGVHPGSGSQRPLIRNNVLERNRIGLFWCWGVKFGLAEGNRIRDNSHYGVSIGHNDTDNVMRDNDIVGSGRVGLLFRDDKRGQDFWPNRNTVEKNRIVNSGGDEGIAIDIRGKTRDLRIVGNEIRETRGPAQRIGIRISADAANIELADNVIEGFSKPILDARPTA